MEYRRLGKSGLKLSTYSFGSWVTFANQYDVKLAQDLMSYAYDMGVNFFDNAEAYMMGESEIVMGKVLKELAWTRNQLAKTFRRIEDIEITLIENKLTDKTTVTGYTCTKHYRTGLRF